MSTTFISASTTSGTGTEITLERPLNVQEGDLLQVWILIGADTASPPSAPDKWMERWWIPSVGNTFRLGGLLKWAEADEALTYTFTFGGSFTYAAVMTAYRGVVRNFTVGGGSYPWGLFRVGLGAGTTENLIQGAASTTLNIVSGGLPEVATPYCRSTFVFAQEGVNPKLEDPSPLVPIRALVQTATLALMVADVEYTSAFVTIPDVLVKSTHNGVWVTIGDPLDPLVAAAAGIDNYKSKLLRRTMPPPYDSRLSSNLGKLLTVIGTSDNEIGGLYGSDDFLPDEA